MNHYCNGWRDCVKKLNEQKINVLFHWRGKKLELLGAKAAWDPLQKILFLADLHLGKAETFQCYGIPFPSDGDCSTLNDLLNLAHQMQPEQVMVLGDLIHSHLGLTPELRLKLKALPELLGCPLRLIGGDVTPIAAPVLMRASGVIKPLSIAGGLPGAYVPGEPNAVCRRCTRSGAALPTAWLLAAWQIARY